MEGNTPRIVIDTNVLISSIVFQGKPSEVLLLVSAEKVIGVISPILIIELLEVLNKKFPLSFIDLQKIEQQIKTDFIVIQPRMNINILQDEPDNRLLEVATEGKCQFIVTGDKELLRLGMYKNIKILTVNEFLQLMNISAKN